MNSLIKKCLVTLLLLILVAVQVQQAVAAKGVPGSPSFGVGAALHLDGPMRDEAINLLGDLHPDWLYVPLSWASIQPAAEGAPDLAVLDQVMAAAGGQQIAVTISLSQAPGWALTGQGPDAELTAQFSTLLAQRYPQALQALELFPRANTLTGWGSTPNPAAYLALFATVQDRLKASGSTMLLVAAGLQPLGKNPGQVDPAVEMDDLLFLQGMYDAGGRDRMQLISLQYASIDADLMASPYDGAESLIFRHYERVREKMLANQHSGGLIWITAFGWPSTAADQNGGTESAAQHSWLQQAYYQVHAQLYIGTAILQSLNPAPDTAPIRAVAMLQPGGGQHSFYQQLKQMALASGLDGSVYRPGSSKMGNLLKNRP